MDGTRSLVVIHLIIFEHFHDIPYLLSICALDIHVICYVSPCAKGCKVCNYKHAQYSRKLRQYPLRCDELRALLGYVLDPETIVHFYGDTSTLYLCEESV